MHHELRPADRAGGEKYPLRRDAALTTAARRILPVEANGIVAAYNARGDRRLRGGSGTVANDRIDTCLGEYRRQMRRREIGRTKHNARGNAFELQQSQHESQLPVGRNEDRLTPEVLRRDFERAAVLEICQAGSTAGIGDEPPRRKSGSGRQVPERAGFRLPHAHRVRRDHPG